MKVLLINKFYFPSGGAERCVFEWERALRERGHETAVFSMAHPRNAAGPQSPWFVSRVDFTGAGGPLGRFRAAVRSVYSREARRKLRALVGEVRPDVAHVHSYCYQLTPSVFDPLREAGIPVVQTAHEYYHVCANQRLLNSRTSAICEQCRTTGLAPLWTRCVKGSLAASAAACAAKTVDRVLGMSRRGIDRVVTPSAFMRNKMIEFGQRAERIVHVPNFVDTDDIQAAPGPGSHVLFVGRLVRHKGPLTLLRAAAQLRDVPIKFVGDGPLSDELRAAAQEQGLDNVEFSGFLQGSELRRAVADSRAVVVPSEWYENASLVVLEAMAAARAVVASDIGGIGEQVRHEQEGLLFRPGDVEGLVACLRRLWDNPEEAASLGRKGRARAESLFSVETHYQSLMALFQELLG